MIKIVGTGMLGADDDVDQNQFDMNPRLVAEVARKNADVIVGIKTAHWRQPSFISVERALEAAQLANLPIMVDFGYFDTKPYQALIQDKLRPGDISTHFYRVPAPCWARTTVWRTTCRPCASEQYIRCGPWRGKLSFLLAEPMVKQRFWPDSISTDVHSGSVNGQ
jgi:dihydroorotase